LALVVGAILVVGTMTAVNYTRQTSAKGES